MRITHAVSEFTSREGRGLFRMTKIRNDIVKGLRDYLGCHVVPTDTSADRPEYPFISYKITSPLSSGKTYSLIDKPIFSEPGKPADSIELIRREQAGFTMSVSAYSQNESEACDLAIKTANWFNFIGYLFLKEINVVVVNVSVIGDRTTQIVDSYEKRYGFDVRFRVARDIRTVIETIERYNISGTVNPSHSDDGNV